MTRLCGSCEHEITAELVAVDGQDDVAHLAGVEASPSDNLAGMSATLQATIRLACTCSYLDVRMNSNVSPFADVPDSWADDEAGELVESVSLTEVNDE